MPINEKDTIN